MLYRKHEQSVIVFFCKDRSEISGGDISKKRQRALVLKDVSKLRATIQALTGNVIPLVKIMDFLQEDLDCMKKEMEQWKDEIQANTLALQHEQRCVSYCINDLICKSCWSVRNCIIGQLRKVQLESYDSV